MPFLLLLMLMGLLPACDRADAPRPPAESADPDPDRPASAYGRRLLFLAGTEAAPVAVVFDFATVDAPAEARHGIGAWIAAGGRGWDPLVSLDWTDTPVREPWRLVPRGPLRLVVDDAGELEALVHRADSNAFRLQPTVLLGEWSPGETARYWLRRAELQLVDASHAGLLLDVQTGALGPGGPAPAEAFVTDGDALRLVVPLDAAGPATAWLQRGDSTETWEGVSMLADSARSADGRGPAWRLGEPTGSLLGELRALGPELPIAALDGVAFDPAAVHAVRGWVEVRGARRPVFGLLRRGSA